MKRAVLLVVLVLSLVGVSAATVPQAEAWSCPPGVPYCTLGNNAQCDSWCGGPGWGSCVRPGCCSCLA
ncbi:MAG TPA: hypothetical protein VEL74_15510 [Thermoanaerobaculia bacterium]|nr:hypothetical protein [Thermoanaerobaculia bacterium]